jgi:hypothetical protein
MIEHELTESNLHKSFKYYEFDYWKRKYILKYDVLIDLLMFTL